MQRVCHRESKKCNECVTGNATSVSPGMQRVCHSSEGRMQRVCHRSRPPNATSVSPRKHPNATSVSPSEKSNATSVSPRVTTARRTAESQNRDSHPDHRNEATGDPTFRLVPPGTLTHGTRLLRLLRAVHEKAHQAATREQAKQDCLSLVAGVWAFQGASCCSPAEPCARHEMTWGASRGRDRE